MGTKKIRSFTKSYKSKLMSPHYYYRDTDKFLMGQYDALTGLES